MNRKVAVALVVVAAVALVIGVYVYFNVVAPTPQSTSPCLSSCGDIYYPGNG